MGKSHEILKNYTFKKSKFLNLPPGETVKVKFLYAEVVPNYFDGGKTKCVRYHFEVKGKELLWDRTSRSLAEKMSEIKEGEVIKIKRIGKKSKTKYYINREKNNYFGPGFYVIFPSSGLITLPTGTYTSIWKSGTNYYYNILL